MSPLLPTVIIRHRKENLKKCSLRGLENRRDILFATYPFRQLPPLQGYVLLSFDGPLLSQEDAPCGLLLLDGTWRYAATMMRELEKHILLPRRSLSPNWRTAYPRRQEDCEHPQKGLASVEALFAAYFSMGYSPQGLLDNYYWLPQFEALNNLKPSR